MDPGSPSTSGKLPPSIRVVGRYALHREIAAGGMATVHLGRLLGPVGFSRTVAIKRLHPQFAREPEFVSMFLDEARLAARIRHPNVVSTLDVVAADGEIFLVMEYIQGEVLSNLLRFAAARSERVPPRIAASIIVGCLHGLHAAHEARDEQGAPLHIVHRDVSPQNMLVGIDGIPHLLDFGIARAAGRLVTTREGHVKGKFAYMAPEQLHGEPATRKSDIFGAAIVLWETLAGERLFRGETEAATLERVLFADIPGVRTRNSELPESIDAVIRRGLARASAARFSTAREMALALEEVLGVASPTEVAIWLERTARDSLASRAAVVAEVESSSTPAPDQPAPALPRPPTGAPIPVIRERATAPAEAQEPPPLEPTEKRVVRRGPSRWSSPASIASVVAALAIVVAVVVMLARRPSATSSSPWPSSPVSAASPPSRAAEVVPSSAPSAAEPARAASAKAMPSAAPAELAKATASTPAASSASPPTRAPRSAPRSPPLPDSAKGLKGLPTDRE
jgi:serine/threonine-protein kinase